MHKVPQAIKVRQMIAEGKTNVCKVFSKSWKKNLSRRGNKFFLKKIVLSDETSSS